MRVSSRLRLKASRKGTALFGFLFALSDNPVNLNALFYHYLKEWDCCESDIYGNDEHELFPAPFLDADSDDDLAESGAEAATSINDSSHCGLAALAALNYLLFANICGARGRNDVVKTTYNEAEAKHHNRQGRLRHCMQLICKGETHNGSKDDS